MQYKQRCAELEAQRTESTVPLDPTVPARPTTLHLPAPASSALEEAQQHLRELREERIHDLDTALRRLEEERRRYSLLFFFSIFKRFVMILLFSEMKG